MSNKDAVEYLERIGITNANYTVSRLIEGGFIEDVVILSEPERLVEGAKKWLGRYGSVTDSFNKASGWGNDSWRVVMNESYLDPVRKYQFTSPNEIQWIFPALVILAKEAGVDL